MKAWDQVKVLNDADEVYGFVGDVLFINGDDVIVQFDDLDLVLNYKVSELKLVEREKY